MKNALKRLRKQPTISALLYGTARPIHDFAHHAQFRISRHILRNGGAVTYDGIPLVFPRGIGIGYLSSISWHGVRGFEPATWAALRRLIEHAGTFLDIGANIGFYSVLAKKVAPQVKVISFEPIPAICAQNRSFHAANGLAANVHQIALSDHNGEAMIFQPIEDQSTTATLERDSWQASGAHAAAAVPTAKLDSFLFSVKLQTPLMIKLDVEDHEASVLRGAIATIGKYRPSIVCEILPRKHNNAMTTAILSEIGYVAFAITPAGNFRFTDHDFKKPRSFTDFLLLPAEEVTGNYF